MLDKKIAAPDKIDWTAFVYKKTHSPECKCIIADREHM
jgi:hypothetical protein